MPLKRSQVKKITKYKYAVSNVNPDVQLGKYVTLPTLPSEKNDIQLQKLDGDQIHSVPTISKVGGDASHGSRRVVASMHTLLDCVAVWWLGTQSARDNHLPDCNFAKYLPILKLFYRQTRQ